MNAGKTNFEDVSEIMRRVHLYVVPEGTVLGFSALWRGIIGGQDSSAAELSTTKPCGSGVLRNEGVERFGLCS
jgi:hypothetical protein